MPKITAPKVGDAIKSLTGCDNLPAGTIVGFAHPIYQAPMAAVRWADVHGELFWSWTGHGESRTKTRTIKQATGWAPFVVLHLPDGAPLNTEVRTGYRTFGAPE
jgi:hypothetical protein